MVALEKRQGQLLPPICNDKYNLLARPIGNLKNAILAKPSFHRQL